MVQRFFLAGGSSALTKREICEKTNKTPLIIVDGNLEVCYSIVAGGTNSVSASGTFNNTENRRK